MKKDLLLVVLAIAPGLLGIAIIIGSKSKRKNLVGFSYLFISMILNFLLILQL